MKVACLIVDHIPFKLEAAQEPMLGRCNAIIFNGYGSQRTVLDVSPTVQQVFPGMPLHEAQARCKDSLLMEADMPRYQRAFDRILLRLSEWSPVVESADLGCAYVGLDGLEDTFGSEERLINGLLQAVPQNLEPRLGVSQGKFPAYLAARSASPGRAYRPPMNLKEFMAQASVDVLPVPWEVKDRLHSFGLHTLGQITTHPLGPIQAQFGSDGTRLWKLAHGVDDSPLLSRHPEEEITASFMFAVPTVNMEPLLMAVENLLARLFANAEMRGRYARVAILEGQVLRRPPWQRRFVFKVPMANKQRAFFVIKAGLDNITLPGPLEEVRLSFRDLTGEAGRQESLFQEVRKRDRLREAIAQLKVSSGQNLIYQVREVEPWSRIPERQRALVPYEP